MVHSNRPSGASVKPRAANSTQALTEPAHYGGLEPENQTSKRVLARKMGTLSPWATGAN